jgi:beta-lactam-binding protein with PASTA domain
MALRIATRLPRLAIVGVVLLLASATLAVGAAKRLTAVPKGAPAPLTAATMVVPDVTGQAFVFAKGTLEDTGFAWRVVGSVHGYAANKVASQTPAAGTRVVDTGAPTITLGLERTAYPERGEPEDVSPYVGTSVRLAFAVPDAPREPLKEMPLTKRAELLARWINAHPTPSAANVRHFLYQHTWVVTGARFGWWHGAEALRLLIATDRVAQQRWGIGRKSELVARRALAEVEARVK